MSTYLAPEVGTEYLAMVDGEWEKVEVLSVKRNVGGVLVGACRVISSESGNCGLLRWCSDFKTKDAKYTQDSIYLANQYLDSSGEDIGGYFNIEGSYDVCAAYESTYSIDEIKVIYEASLLLEKG